MNIKRRLKSFTALALSLSMGLQFYPVLGEETTGPVTSDFSSSTNVDWSLNTYTARSEGTAFALGLTFEQGTVLHAGDTMSLALPEGYSFSDITEALPLYAMRDGVPGEMLASYTISGNVLSLVFNEVTDLTGVTTELTVTGTPVETQTEGYYKEHTWTMENDSDGTVNTVSFNVPASDIMNWTWVSEDGTWSTTVDSIQETTAGTTLVLSNTATAVSAYTFTLPEGIKADNADAELSYTPANPDGTRSEQSISIGTYNVTDNTLSANVTTVPPVAVTVSLPFTWNTEPQQTQTPEIVDEELIEAITEGNEKLNETPAPTESPVTTATPETTETPVPTETPVTTPEPTETPIVTPTPEPTETPEAASNEINMMAEGRVEKDEVIEHGTWSMSASYNGVSNTQDIYWIDNSNGEETRPTQEQFNNLFNKDSINLKATMTNSGTGGTASTVTFKDVMRLLETYQQTGIDNFVFDTANLGGTGHWQATVTHLPETITLRRTNKVAATVDANGNVLTTRDETETHTIQLSDWTIEPTKPDAEDDQGNPITIDLIPGSDTNTGYSFVNVFDDPDTTDVDYVDQNGRPRPGAASLGEGWYFVQETDYQADIVLRRGNNVLSTADDVDTLINTIKNVYTFYYDTGFPSDQPGALSGKLSLASDVYVDVKREGFADAKEVPTLTFTISDLEKYNLDGSEIIYNIDQTATDNKSDVINASNFHVFKDPTSKYYGDYLAEEINNDPVSNHGTDITKCYDGGTIYLTLTGETNYKGYKDWHDQYAIDQGWNRPKVTFTLWRFTQKTDSDLATAYQSASPVQATGGRTVGSGGTPINAMQTASETIQSHKATEESSKYTVTFVENFVAEGTSEEKYPDKYLPKYDAEGYTYVYFARETMSGEHANDYRTEFGKLESEPGNFFGKFLDTLPGGEDAVRDGDDNSIYNGGTISNVINGTTRTEVRKTWIADAFQSELGDVTVQFKLQARAVGEDTWNDVPDRIFRMGHTDKDIESIKDDGTGGQGVPFVAENLMQTHSTNMPLYDNWGNELEYRWVEDKIFQDGVEVTRDDKGGFKLTQNGETVSYTSTTINPLDDSTLTDIVNEIVDVTEYNVDKFWSEELKDYFNDSENNFDQDTINKVNSGTYWPVSLKMYRSNSKNESEELVLSDGKGNITPDKYFQLDGNIDEEATPLYAPNPDFDETIADTGDIEGYNPKYVRAGEVKETEKWHAEYINLDLYDEGGSPFDYIVLEANEDGVFWSADYSVTVDEESGITTFVITNGPPPGDSDRIYVRKRWLDDGDEQHRGNVTMTAYRINDNADVNNLKWTDLTPLNSTVLNRENNWWDSITIASNVEENGIVVLETSIAGAQEGEQGTDLTSVYANDTTGLLTAIYNDQHDIEDDNNSYFQYQTKHHDYEATFSMVNLEDVEFYTVTNRRLGRVDITVTKQWLDGKNDKKVRNEFINEIEELGYELVLQLVPAERQDFDVAKPDIDYADNSIKLVNEQQKIQKPADTTTQDKDNLEDAEAIQVIDTANANSTYYFWNLPKYNEYGKIVRYDVIEGVRMQGAENPYDVIPIAQFVRDKKIDTEYTFGHVQNSYTTSSDINPDDQEITITNRLSGTKQVYFWKEWNDAYRYKMSPTQRPDIYLGLYRYNKGTEALEQLYSDIEWTFYDDKYISLSDFGYMAKYDNQGNEYIYYAREYVKLEDKAQFDYKDVYYKYDSELENPALSDQNVDEILDGKTSIGNETSVAAKTDNQEWVDQYGNKLMMYESNAKINLLKEYGAFVNDIEANVEISGQKIWANVPVGFEDEDLIPVTFYVFQYTNEDEIPIISGDGADYLTSTADGTERFNPLNSGNENNLPYLKGKQAYAWVTINDWELQKYMGTYPFSIEYVGRNTNDVIQTADDAGKYVDDEFVNKNYDTNGDGEADLVPGNIVVKPKTTETGSVLADSAQLPKYDDEGNLYTYVLRESGYFGNSDANADDKTGDGRDYVFTQPIMNNFAITNAYTPVKGEINVRKILDISKFGNLVELGEIPAVTFTLTREYKATDWVDNMPVMVQDVDFSREITLNADGFTKVEGQEKVFVQEGKFEDLEIYAPNGNKYVYTITENPKLDNGSHLIQGGYEAYGANGWHELEVSQSLNPDEGDENAYSISGLYPKYVEKADNPVTAVINGIGDFFIGIGEFLGITKQENPTADDTSWVTFKNVYKKVEAPLEFGKTWEDNGQSNGRFTTPLTFEVRQWAATQPGQNNAINTKDTLMGTFTITLKENPNGQLSVKDQSSVRLTKEDSIYGSIAVKFADNQDKTENVLNYIDSVTVYVDSPDPATPQTLGNNKNWKIKIEGFQTYAPNGMPWQYQLKEVDAYPYIITNATMEFRYDGTTSTFVRTNGSNVLTNTSRIIITGTKNITTAAAPDGDYADGNQTVWNYTGFDVKVNFDVYATFVKANSWEDAMAEMLKEPTNDAQTNTTWVNLKTDTTATYRQDLIVAMNAYEESKDPTFTASTVFPNIEKDENTPSFGKQSASYKNLPRVFDTADGTVYASYILLETSIELIDGKDVNGNDIVVYREEMKPNFVWTKVPDGIDGLSTVYKVGDPVIAYYFGTPTAELLNTSNNTLDTTEYIFMNPVFDSLDDVTNAERGMIGNFTFKGYEEWLPYVWIGKYDKNDSSEETYINDQFNTYETMNINISKTWVDDNGNIYDTRSNLDKDNNWEVNYQLEVKNKTVNRENWIKLPLEVTNSRYQVITGNDSQDTVEVSYINLPASGIFKKEDGSYVALSKDQIEYRIRELNTDDNKTPIDTNGTYNSAYTVTYDSTSATQKQPLKLKMTNTLKTINAEATKKWDDWSTKTDNVLTSPVTFELQYQSNKDENNDGQNDWKSFDTKAIVTLNGQKDTAEERGDKPYYEYSPWHAIWNDIPQIMPGSFTTIIGEGENAEERTVYRVIEVSLHNNVYGRYVKDGTTHVLLPGSGTEGDEYILQDVTEDTVTDLSFEITNALTVFELRKTVSKPSDASLTKESNEKFTFTISPADKIPSSAKYQKYNAKNEPIEPILSSTTPNQFKGTVTLKDGEYVKIFGLQKDVEYTVTESTEDNIFDYAVTYSLRTLDQDTGVSTNNVTLPAKETKTTKFQTPIMEATNTVLGSVTITKEDLNGNKLEGISFELEYLSDPKTNSWLPAEYWENGVWVKPAIEEGNIEESNKEGKVIFSNLRVFDENLKPIQYRLTEVAAPGYHKYPEPIEFQLPYAPKDKDQTNEGSNAFYTIGTGENAVSYYPEVTMTIKNDHAFVMPQTSGTGFFWPGMIGVAVSVLSAGGYVVTRKKKKREEENEEVN